MAPFCMLWLVEHCLESCNRCCKSYETLWRFSHQMSLCHRVHVMWKGLQIVRVRNRSNCQDSILSTLSAANADISNLNLSSSVSNDLSLDICFSGCKEFNRICDNLAEIWQFEVIIMKSIWPQGQTRFRDVASFVTASPVASECLWGREFVLSANGTFPWSFGVALSITLSLVSGSPRFRLKVMTTANGTTKSQPTRFNRFTLFMIGATLFPFSNRNSGGRYSRFSVLVLNRALRGRKPLGGKIGVVTNRTRLWGQAICDLCDSPL
jgi:hypothetical protein